MPAKTFPVPVDFNAPTLSEREKTRQWFYERSEVDNKGCWNWKAIVQNSGYGMVGARGLPKAKYTAHRLSYLLTRGPIPDGMLVCHSCDNRRCVNPEHLWLGTPKQNQRDSWEKERRVPVPAHLKARGKGHGRAKLTDELVMEIKKSPKDLQSIAVQYGVSKTCIFNIKSGRTWAHVTLEGGN